MVVFLGRPEWVTGSSVWLKVQIVLDRGNEGPMVGAVSLHSRKNKKPGILVSRTPDFRSLGLSWVI